MIHNKFSFLMFKCMTILAILSVDDFFDTF
jgi:hypothetical protein